VTYRFQLRAGLHYSTGTAVRARDVRASIERLHRMGAITLGSYPLGVVGEQRCNRRRCDLSAGIETDDATGTVTFRLRRPNPDFLLNLATPPYSILPAGAPLHDLTGPELVGTGPYHVTSFARGHQVTLERNPRFRAWAPAAQPDGFPDRIIWRLTRPGDTRATRTADLAMDPSPAELKRLRVAAPTRIRLTPYPSVVFVWLNTRVPPFDRVDARRAVAYGTDRRAIMRALPATQRALRRPNCQLLSPGLPGYEPTCPFALRPVPAAPRPRHPTSTAHGDSSHARRPRAPASCSGLPPTTTRRWPSAAPSFAC
jgi:peptide/nickel transport system substrate-binding protein